MPDKCKLTGHQAIFQSPEFWLTESLLQIAVETRNQDLHGPVEMSQGQDTAV